MVEQSPILGAVVALVAWSLVMWLWMYATRIPAIAKANLELDPNAPNGQQMALLPPRVRWKADNYNHLMEQPTLFYAIAITLAVLGAGDGVNATLAWAYVGLRVLHSLIQVLVNKIEVRFLVFTLSTLPLIALTYNATKLFL
ncbi:MAPEG family protein [Litorivivens sp.]|uniref:MAPEG family protein n=1 Tax=Litorivivens sp. TaxID=2020868 RepID=UPI00356752D5